MEAFCRLWDLSINSSVCELMHNLDLVKILETLLVVSDPVPRVQEICFGILANMAAVPTICSQLCKVPTILRSLVEIVMTSIEPAPISEALRFLSVIIVHLGPNSESECNDSSAAATTGEDRDCSSTASSTHQILASTASHLGETEISEGGSSSLILHEEDTEKTIEECSLESILDDSYLLNQVKSRI